MICYSNWRRLVQKFCVAMAANSNCKILFFSCDAPPSKWVAVKLLEGPIIFQIGLMSRDVPETLDDSMREISL